MLTVLTIINYLFVLFYGAIIMMYFADIPRNRKNNIVIAVCLGFCIILQVLSNQLLGVDITFKIYPIIVHLPLVLLFIFYFKQPITTSLFSLFSAYVFTIPRRWLGLLFSGIFGGSTFIYNLTLVLASIPLLFVICRYIAPFFTDIQQRSKKEVRLFTAIPMVFYIFTYMTTVYSKLLYSGNPIFIESLNTILVSCFFLFSIMYFNELNTHMETEHEKKILKLKTDKALQHIENLQKSEKQIREFRHDLRHHLQFISMYLSQNKIEEAQEYIQDIYHEIDNSTVLNYSKNNVINLILSSYIPKAEQKGFLVEHDIKIGDELPVSTMDICIILSNALENAIHACEKVSAPTSPLIRIRVFQKNKQVFIQISNSYEGEILFKNGIPISRDINHGLGVKSIISVINKYDGYYQFETTPTLFILNIVL